MPNAEPVVPLLQEWIGAFMRRSMRSLILFLKENDLSMTQLGALFQIKQGKSNVSDLGEWLGISIAAASQMLERLVQQELVLRSEDLQDRRAKHLILTDKGCRILEKTIQARRDWLKELVSTLSVGEKEQIATAVRVLIDRTNLLDQHSESES